MMDVATALCNTARSFILGEAERVLRSGGCWCCRMPRGGELGSPLDPGQPSLAVTRGATANGSPVMDVGQVISVPRVQAHKPQTHYLW